jgi:hypothetical protein
LSSQGHTASPEKQYVILSLLSDMQQHATFESRLSGLLLKECFGKRGLAYAAHAIQANHANLMAGHDSLQLLYALRNAHPKIRIISQGHRQITQQMR